MESTVHTADVTTRSRPRAFVKRDFAACAGLLILTSAVFLPTITYGFVNWDDPWYVLNNPLIANWRPANLYEIATKPAVRNYAPVTMFVYLVEHSLFGNWAGGYHVTNVVIHAINVVLAYILIKQLLGSRLVATTAAALFGIHPVQVETVAWVSSLKGLLSGTFILASLICWLRPRPSPRQEGFGLLFHALGLLSKALGITVPAIVFTYDVLVGRKPIAESIARQLVPCILGVLVLLVTMSAQTADLGGSRAHLGWSKGRIAAVDAVILWDYVGLLAWPHELCVLYDPPTSGLGAAIALAIAGWTAVGAAAFAARRRYPLVPLALVSFGALLFPVLNFFPITTLINDRYLYLPSIPMFALLAAGIQAACNTVCRRTVLLAASDEPDRPSARTVRAVLSRSLCGALLGVLVLEYAASTADRLPVWRNDRALWNDAIGKSPGLAVVRIQWAIALHDAKQAGDAVAVLERALAETNPDDADRQRILSKIAEWKEGAIRVE